MHCFVFPPQVSVAVISVSSCVWWGWTVSVVTAPPATDSLQMESHVTLMKVCPHNYHACMQLNVQSYMLRSN